MNILNKILDKLALEGDIVTTPQYRHLYLDDTVKQEIITPEAVVYHKTWNLEPSALLLPGDNGQLCQCPVFEGQVGREYSLSLAIGEGNKSWTFGNPVDQACFFGQFKADGSIYTHRGYIAVYQVTTGGYRVQFMPISPYKPIIFSGTIKRVYFEESAGTGLFARYCVYMKMKQGDTESE